MRQALARHRADDRPDRDSRGAACAANVLLFDFRGHGESDGHTVRFGAGERRDVLAAVAYLRERRPGQARQVVGLGVSMGAATLTLAAAEAQPPLDAVILNSGFAAAGDVAEHLCGWLPPAVRPLVAAVAAPLASLDAGCWIPGIRPEEHVRWLRAPVLVVHARGDRLVPVAHAARLFNRAAEPRALWLPNTGDLCSAIEHPAGYLEEVARLLSHRLPPTPLTARLTAPQPGPGRCPATAPTSRRRTPSTSAPEVATRL